MSNLKLFVAALVRYLLEVTFYSLFLIIIIGSLNLILHYLHFPIFSFREWLCSYATGYITIFILNIKFFTELYENAKERANTNG